MENGNKAKTLVRFRETAAALQKRLERLGLRIRKGWTIHDGSGDLRSFRLFPDVSTRKISDGPYEQASFFDV